MLSPRLRLQQSLFQRCGTIQLRFAQQHQHREASSSSSSRPDNKPSRRNQPQDVKPQRRPPQRQRPNLVEELFPESSIKTTSTSSVSEQDADVKLERLPLSENEFEFLDLNIPGSERGVIAEDEDARPSDEKERSLSNVLVLSCASKSLAESDFVRLGPKGEHIPGWTSGITKVIPGRDDLGLQPLGHYFLVFSTPSAASAYRDHLIRTHQLAREYTNVSLTAPGRPLPPAGYLTSGGIDIQAAIRGFTLAPASQKELYVRQLQDPIRGGLRDTLRYGGHKVVETKLPRTRGRVLLSFYGRETQRKLREAIARDGRERNLEWGLWGQNDIVEIGTEKPLQRRTAAEEDDNETNEEKQMFGPTKYIISFKDITEARSFIRTWHRRPLPWDDNLGTQGYPKVFNAELLW